MTNLAARLKKARKMKGLSQMALGVAAGIDEGSASARMNQYERGVHVPHLQMMTKIAEALQMPVAYFYADNDALADLIYGYHQLNAKDKTKIKKTIAELLRSD